MTLISAEKLYPGSISVLLFGCCQELEEKAAIERNESPFYISRDQNGASLQVVSTFFFRRMARKRRNISVKRCCLWRLEGGMKQQHFFLLAEENVTHVSIYDLLREKCMSTHESVRTKDPNDIVKAQTGILSKCRRGYERPVKKDAHRLKFSDSLEAELLFVVLEGTHSRQHVSLREHYVIAISK